MLTLSNIYIFIPGWIQCHVLMTVLDIQKIHFSSIYVYWKSPWVMWDLIIRALIFGCITMNYPWPGSFSGNGNHLCFWFVCLDWKKTKKLLCWAQGAKITSTCSLAKIMNVCHYNTERLKSSYIFSQPMSIQSGCKFDTLAPAESSCLVSWNLHMQLKISLQWFCHVERGENI